MNASESFATRGVLRCGLALCGLVANRCLGFCTWLRLRTNGRRLTRSRTNFSCRTVHWLRRLRHVVENGLRASGSRFEPLFEFYGRAVHVRCRTGDRTIDFTNLPLRIGHCITNARLGKVHHRLELKQACRQGLTSCKGLGCACGSTLRRAMVVRSIGHDVAQFRCALGEVGQLLFSGNGGDGGDVGATMRKDRLDAFAGALGIVRCLTQSIEAARAGFEMPPFLFNLLGHARGVLDCVLGTQHDVGQTPGVCGGSIGIDRRTRIYPQYIDGAMAEQIQVGDRRAGGDSHLGFDLLDALFQPGGHTMQPLVDLHARLLNPFLQLGK